MTELVKLVELAQEKSSEKRRALLHDLTDLFIADPSMREGEAGAQADAVLTTVAAQVETEVRAALAERFADADAAPPGLIRELALDAIEVARPLLERAGVIDDAVLVEATRTHGGAHAQAIAGRAAVSESVAEAIAVHGDDAAVETLVRNPGARLSRDACETLVDRAENTPSLHAPLVSRTEVDPDLLNELAEVVEASLRAQIEERIDAISPEDAAKAAAAARARLTRKMGPRPSDYDEAERYVQAQQLRKKLTPQLIADLLRSGDDTRAEVAFATLAELDYAAARRALRAPKVDALAIASRAARIARDDFVRLALMRRTEGRREESDADTLGLVYEALPVEAADRSMRFLRVRTGRSEAA